MALGIYFLVPIKIASMITEYKPYTFESVLLYDSMRADFGINEKQAPEDYGYDEVEEFTITSLYDSINLNAWYVPSSQRPGSIVLVHGRTSNRLKTMKYLALFKEKGIDSLYNILIPDLRNSGKSEPAKTFMGYKFAEDLTAYLQYLKREKRQDTVVLYGFSMGAMAVMTMMNRPDLMKIIDENKIVIEKVILDSPLSSVKATLKINADEMGLPDFIFDAAFERFSGKINDFGENMHLSYLMGSIEAPVLLLQGKNDQTTPHGILQEELKNVAKENLEIVYFEEVGHVRIYQNEKHKKTYTEKVAEFIRGRQKQEIIAMPPTPADVAQISQ